MRAADPFDAWLAAADTRYRSELSFAELRRGVQALSSLYVERRAKLTASGPLGSAGKRAAFGSFFGPLHFLIVQCVVRELEALDGNDTGASRILDLGCGTGAAGAAWALHAARDGRPIPALTGYDRHSWAVEETRWTYRTLGVRGRVSRADLNRVRLPRDDTAIVLAYTVNELDDDARAALLPNLLRAANRGGRVLVVEPISRRLTPWWNGWAESFLSAGGRADDWRFDVELPEILWRLDRAAGLDHSELTARTLWIKR